MCSRDLPFIQPRDALTLQPYLSYWWSLRERELHRRERDHLRAGFRLTAVVKGGERAVSSAFLLAPALSRYNVTLGGGG